MHSKTDHPHAALATLARYSAVGLITAALAACGGGGGAAGTTVGASPATPV
ncbi:MAG: hypothetical protein JWR65_1198, partial [Massilia sp.]|nr:hypothetical protein [Massilia sp.]